MVKRLNLHLQNWGSLKREGGGHHFPHKWQYSPIFARAIPWMFQGMHKVIQRCQTDSQILSCHRQDAACCSVTVDSSQTPRRSQMSSWCMAERDLLRPSWGRLFRPVPLQQWDEADGRWWEHLYALVVWYFFDIAVRCFYILLHYFLVQCPRSWLGTAVCVRGAESYTSKVQSCPAQFPFEELRGNRELVLGALQENGLMLEHATQDLRGDGMHWPWHLCKILPMWQLLKEFRLVASVDVS